MRKAYICDEFIQKLVEKGIQITENNVKISMSSTSANATGNLRVLERAESLTDIVPEEGKTESE